MKNPLIIAALIVGAAAVVCTAIVMEPVYQCIYSDNHIPIFVCLHGHHPAGN
jgi:hypothetical protein